MTLQEAIKSGKQFKRPHWPTYAQPHHTAIFYRMPNWKRGGSYRCKGEYTTKFLTKEDAVANDYIVLPDNPEHLQAQVNHLRDTLIDVKKDIEENAADTLWVHEGYAETIVDRIEIALERDCKVCQKCKGSGTCS